jgi:hypothetical protein
MKAVWEQKCFGYRWRNLLASPVSEVFGYFFHIHTYALNYTATPSTTCIVPMPHKFSFLPWLQTKRTHQGPNAITIQKFRRIDVPWDQYVTNGKREPFNYNGGIKAFRAENRLTLYLCTSPALQKILKGILHTEEEENHKWKSPGKNKIQSGSGNS